MQNMFKYAIEQVWISLLIVSVFASQWSTAHIHLPQDHGHHETLTVNSHHEDAFGEHSEGYGNNEGHHSHKLEHHNHHPSDHLFDIDNDHSSSHVVVLDDECTLSQGKLFKHLAITQSEFQFQESWVPTTAYLVSYAVLTTSYQSPTGFLPLTRAPPA